MKAVFASALVAAATALPWEDSQSKYWGGYYGGYYDYMPYEPVSYVSSYWVEPSIDKGHSGVSYDVVLTDNANTRGSITPASWRTARKIGTGMLKNSLSNAEKNAFCSYFSVYRPGKEGSSALEHNMLGDGKTLITGPNKDQWDESFPNDAVESATKSTFCKACFGGDDVQTTARFCKACFGGDVEVQTKFCKACFGGDDAETNARFCKACFGGDDAEVKARFCKSCFGGDDAETNARFCKSCFGGDDAEVKARFCKACFGGDDVETTARFCKSCFGGDDAEVKARFCKSCFGGDDVATTVAFCKSCFGGDDAEVKARFCKSCFGGDVETHARFCKSCFGGDDAEVHSRFCKSCFGGDVEARVKCDCSNKTSSNHYGLGSKWSLLKSLMSKAYSILAAAHELGVDPDACECALGTDSSTKHYLPGGGLAYDKYALTAWGVDAPKIGAYIP